MASGWKTVDLTKAYFFDPEPDYETLLEKRKRRKKRIKFTLDIKDITEEDGRDRSSKS